MANYGVNLEEVWQQTSLVPSHPGPTKRSPYTVPVQQQQQSPQQLSRQNIREGMENSRRMMSADDIPISGTEWSPPRAEYPQVHNPPPQLPPSEIPKLKEQLTQQIDAVTDCQKEVVYLRNLIQTLKRELQDADHKRQEHQRAEKKKKTMDLLWMAFIGIVLIGIVLMLVQMSQKVNQLLSQPLLLT